MQGCVTSVQGCIPHMGRPSCLFHGRANGELTFKGQDLLHLADPQPSAKDPPLGSQGYAHGASHLGRIFQLQPGDVAMSGGFLEGQGETLME